MKTIVIMLLALAAGFIGGIVVTEIIAIVGLRLFNGTVWLGWLRYVPFLSAIVCAVAAPRLIGRKIK
ncbi:DUF5957 family protein [Paenibacillus tarimensis]